MPQTYLDSELYIPAPDRARFSWAGHEYEGEPALQPDQVLELFALESAPDEYGRELFARVFPAGSDLREGLHDAMLEAERTQSRLRLRLHLSPGLPDRIHALYWELLADPAHRLGLARSPDTAFSRYSAVPRALGAPVTGRPRMLCVVSAPCDVGRFHMAEIDREEVLRRIETSLSGLDMEVTMLEPPATPGRIRERLMAGDFHILHLFGHGLVQRHGLSALVLEDEKGRVRWVEEKLLVEIFAGDRELRLVTLIACHGGAPSSPDTFSGLAGRLVQRGLPAVIAMRRAVSVDDAHIFTDHLYRQLARTGRVDAAVNEARQQLYLEQPQELGWSSPVLYQRLTDGRLWLPEAETSGEPEDLAERGARLFRFSPRRLLRPLPWVPAGFFLIASLLNALPAHQTPVELDLHVSELAFRLAEPFSVVGRPRLEKIATTRLAALRMPSGEWIRGGAGKVEGFSLAVQPGGATGSHATLRIPPQPAGARISLEHQGGRDYRMVITGSDEEVGITFQGDLTLKRLVARPAPLHLNRAGSLTLVPQSGALDAEVVFSEFTGDEISTGIPIDRLSLIRIEEQHTATTTVVTEVPTILAGEIRLLATGKPYQLKKGETLHFEITHGTLNHMRFEENGIHFRFNGGVAKMERAVAGLPPTNLMPKILNLPASALNAAAALSLLVPFFSAMNVRPHAHRPRQPSPDNPLKYQI